MLYCVWVESIHPVMSSIVSFLQSQALLYVHKLSPPPSLISYFLNTFFSQVTPSTMVASVTFYSQLKNNLLESFSSLLFTWIQVWQWPWSHATNNMTTNSVMKYGNKGSMALCCIINRASSRCYSLQCLLLLFRSVSLPRWIAKYILQFTKALISFISEPSLKPNWL